MTVEQHAGRLLETLGEGKHLSCSLCFQVLDIFAHSIKYFVIKSRELSFKILPSCIVVEGIGIVTFADSLPPFVVFPLFFILNYHAKQHIGVEQSQALPLVDLLSLPLPIQQKSNIPHPQHSVFIESFVLNEQQSLVVVELSPFFKHHLELLFLNRHHILLSGMTFEGGKEPLGVVFSVNDYYLVLFHADLLCIQVEQLVNEGILSLLLVPPVCFSPQLLLHQPHKKPVKVFFLRPLEKLAIEGGEELTQEGTVVAYDVYCSVDRLPVL
jgi:hypothetical protein